MTSPANISELVEIIRSRTQTMVDSLATHDASYSSFEQRLSQTSALPEHLSYAREEVLDATSKLAVLLLGPLQYLTRLAGPTVNILTSLDLIHRFKVAQNLGTDEEVEYEVLADRVGLEADDLRRFLRLAIANYIFCEPRRNIVSHSSVSRILIDLPGSNDWLGLVCDEMLPSGIRASDALTKWPGSHDPAHTGYALAVGKTDSLFATMARDPGRAKRFTNAMGFLQLAQPFDVSFLLKNILWTEYSCPELVVDVGGSSGSVGIAMLEKFHSIRKWMVEDMPSVIGRVVIPMDYVERLSFHDHDLFAPQPIVGADVYFLRSVLHNWEDERAAKILEHQAHAMGEKSQLILNEICLPKPGSTTNYKEQAMRGYDIAMKHTLNAKERDADQWAALITRAHPRLRICSITTSSESLLSIIEVRMQNGL